VPISSKNRAIAIDPYDPVPGREGPPKKWVFWNLENPEDLRSAKAEWKFSPGLVPGKDNEGLVARLRGSPARLVDYDDSGWEVCENIQVGRSSGLTFGWFRITVTLPSRCPACAAFVRVTSDSPRTRLCGVATRYKACRISESAHSLCGQSGPPNRRSRPVPRASRPPSRLALNRGLPSAGQR